MHYYPFNLKDYLVETAHLPPMADLAYRRLLDLYYKEEKPIPNKPKWVANRIRLDSEEAVIGFVLREYFTLDKGVDPQVWRHETCDKVIAKYHKKVEVARANGEKHTPGTKKEPKSVPDRKLTKNQQPRTKGGIPPNPQLGEWFEEWWVLYPLKTAKQDALKAFCKLLPDERLFGILCAAVQRQVAARHFDNASGIANPPYPATWLNGQRWSDEIRPPRPVALVPGTTPQGLNRQEALEAANHAVVDRMLAKESNQ